MAVDAGPRGAASAEPRPPAPDRPSPREPGRLVGVAIFAVGTGTLFVVARDGSLPWQVVRAVVALAATALAAWATRGRGRVSRGLVPLAIGTVATPAGVGIGLPHLAKTGLTLTTVAGLIVLVGGLVLFVAGSWVSMRPLRGWARLLVTPCLVLLLALALLILGQAIGATNVPPTSIGSRTPADLGLTYEEVEFETPDGVVLSGWYVPSTNGAAVALLHGAGSTRTTVIEPAAVLARHGYGVLLYDARGHGLSDGRAMDFGWYGDLDLGGAITFLEGRPDVDPGRLGAVGMSMGGEQAIGAAGSDERIRAVVAEGATNRVIGDKAWLSDEHGWRGALQERIEWLVYGATDLLTDADPPRTLRDAARAAAPRPVLLIAAGDVPDEADAGRYIRGGAPGSVELWVAPGAGHTDALETLPVEWEKRVTRFLDDALDGASP